MSIAYPGRVIKRTVDGIEIAVYQCGDEFMNWYEDTSGNPLIQDEAGNLVYAKWDDVEHTYKAVEEFTKKSRKKYLKAKLSKADEGTVSERQRDGRSKRSHLIAKDGLVRVQGNVHRSASVQSPHNAPPASGSIKKPVVVIYVQFSDSTGTPMTDAEIKALVWNSTKGSVQHFYSQQSRGAVSIENAGIYRVTVPVNGKAWGNDHSTFKSEVISPALALACGQGWNPSTYATGPYLISGLSGEYMVLDNNSCTPLLLVHGYDASFNSPGAPNVWGHAWGGVTFVHNGTNFYVASYMAFGAYGRMSGSSFPQADDLKGIPGLFIHESGHALFNFPDLYDTGHSIAGLGIWTAMAEGEWGELTIPGDCPVNLDPWCITLIDPNLATLDDSSGVKNMASPFDIHKVAGKDNENFLLQIRCFTGYDESLPALMTAEASKGMTKTPGVLILKTDPVLDSMTSVSGAGVMPVRILEAHGGEMDLQRAGSAAEANGWKRMGYYDDLFGALTQTSFDNSTDPSNKLDDGSFPEFGISEISADPACTAKYNINLSGGGAGEPVVEVPKCLRPRFWRMREKKWDPDEV